MSENTKTGHPNNGKLPVTEEMLRVIAATMQECRREDDSVLLAALGNQLRSKGIERRSYTSETLADWMIRLFPGTLRSEDGLSLYPNPEQGAEQDPRESVDQGDYPPAAKTLSLFDLDENLRQMRALAFMGWWSNNVRTLRRYTGCTGNDPQIWSGIFAQKISDILLGRCSDYAQEDLGEGALRFAFYSGIDAIDGRPIYCVLCENKMNKDMQPFMLEDFCCPADESNPELGKWLEEKFGLLSHRRSGADHSQLEAQCHKLNALQSALSTQLTKMLEQLHGGDDPNALDTATLEQYRHARRTLQELCAAAGVPEKLTSAEQVLGWCAEQSRSNSCARLILQAFSQFAQQLHQGLAQTLGLNAAKDGALADPQPAKAALQQACEVYPYTKDLSAFETALAPYRQLLALMSAESLDGVDFLKNTELTQHFGFQVMAVFGLQRANGALFGSFQEALDLVTDRIADLQALFNAGDETQPQRSIPSANALFENALQGDLLALWSAGGSHDALETLILEDRLPEALSMAENAEAMEEAGYEEEDRLQLLSRLQQAQSLPEGLGLCSAALRLQHIFGETNDTAERYLLMGLLTDRAESSAALLKLYRHTGQEEKFSRLWARYEGDALRDVENDLYYLDLLIRRDLQEARLYLDSHVYLYCLPQCAQAVLSCAEEADREQLQQEQSLRFAPIAPNTLEQALIADDRKAVQELLNNRDTLAQLGYSDDQIVQLSQAALSDNIPAGTDAHSTGLRLYLHQGNLHGIAEGFLWQGLAEDPCAQKSETLLCLLAREKRWQECIRLFLCYCVNANISSESRQANLLALVVSEPVKAQPAIRKYTQDFLALAYAEAQAVAAVESYLESTNEGVRNFYTTVYQLIQALSSDLPRSILLHDRSLRSMMAQPGDQLGLDDAQLQKARALYQSGSYNQGTDAISVAWRAYGFLENRNGIAEALARIALPTKSAAELLWKIYGDASQTQEQQLLLQQYETVRQAHPGAYSQYLFDSEQYEAFLSWTEQWELSSMHMLQRAICMLQLDPQAQPELPQLDQLFAPEPLPYTAQLIGILAGLGRTEQLQQLLLDGFADMFLSCSAEQMKQLFTGNGTLTDAQLLAVQEAALARGQQEPVIFLYNLLRIGDHAELANGYYESFTRHYEHDNIEDKLQMEAIAKLYPAKSAELNDRLSLLKVEDLLQIQPATKEIADKVAALVTAGMTTTEGLRELIRKIRGSAYAQMPAVFEAVAGAAVSEELRQDCLYFLHETAMGISTKATVDEVLSNSLYRIYLDALNENRFPQALVDEAEQLCRHLIRSDRSRYWVIFCLYRLELFAGREHKAHFLLRHLLTLPASALDDKLMAVLEAAAEELWGENIPSLLALLRRVLQQQTPEEVMKHCQFCSILSSASDDDRTMVMLQLQLLRKDKAEPASEEGAVAVDSEALVRALLSAPEKPECWQACSGIAGLTPEEKGALLYLCARRNSARWQSCMQFCLETRQDALTLTALCAWADAAPKVCRAYLDDVLLQTPDFFKRWTQVEDIQQLLKMLTALCADISNELATLPSNVAHSALNTISIIATAMAEDAAIDILWQHLSDPLLTSYSEVGVATVLRLMLQDRFGYAKRLLELLPRSGFHVACRNLVDQLIPLEEEDLARWTDEPRHRMLLSLLLPDCNRPTAADIQGFAMNMLLQDRAMEGAQVLYMLTDIFPGDYACYDAIFVLCKNAPELSIPMLHKSLCGLLEGGAVGHTFFRRDSRWNAKLLAGLNAVIQLLHLKSEVQQINPEYDFDLLAGQYCRLKRPETSLEIVNSINEVQQDIVNDLVNLSEDELMPYCQGVLCWVTGQWSDFLLKAWRARNDGHLQPALEASLRLSYDNTPRCQDDIGFCRSLLIAVTALEEQDRLPFLTWIHGIVAGDMPERDPNPWDLKGKRRHIYLVKDLLENDVLTNAGNIPLQLPMEEYSFFNQIKEAYFLPCADDPRLLYYRYWLYGAAADYSVLIQHQYANAAAGAFRRGDDLAATILYEASLRLLHRGLYHSDIMTRPQHHSFLSLYEAHSRISRLMLGDSEIIEKVSSEDFNSWSCLNMVFALLCSPRGNQALRMVAQFHPDSRSLGQTLILAIQPHIPDAEKLSALEELPDSIGKAYVASLICRTAHGEDGKPKPYCFRDARNSMKARDIFWQQAEYFLLQAGEDQPKYFGKKPNGSYYTTRTLVSTFPDIAGVSYSQLPVKDMDPVFATAPAPAADTAASDNSAEDVKQTQRPEAVYEPIEATEPTFAKQATPLPLEPKEEKRLLAQWQALPHLSQHIHARLQLSERLFRAAKAAGKTDVEQLSALIAFGLDLFDHHMELNTSEDIATATRDVLELVQYVCALRPGITDGTEAAKAIRSMENAVEDTVLPSLLDKGHSELRSLVDLFASNRKVFALMQPMVQLDSFRKASVNTIYEALDILVSCYSANAKNHVLLREGLISARKKISTIACSAWLPLKNRLQNLIQRETSILDRRPLLTLRVLNGSSNPEDDFLYCEMQNIGLKEATNIAVQVSYDDSPGGSYMLSHLPPKEHFAFKLRYAAPEGATELHYALGWSYTFGDETVDQPTVEGVIPITEEEEPDFPVGLYETETITDFYDDGHGNIVNPNFFGRKKELKRLINLFRSGRFPGYNNAIIYGIRRAGKSTLLNYLLAYVSAHCDDAIIVKVDCLNNSAIKLVQSHFIDRVLSAVQGRYPQYKEQESWIKLKSSWTMPSDSTFDREPEELELFYQELKAVTGKGLILMMDEVDNLFSAVEQQTSLDSHLFQVLSNMLCSANSQEAVHFILCGSKYLLRYRTGDGGLSQLFQRFGSNLIEVGLLTKGEMEAMLRKPYAGFPEVRFTDEAMDSIWDYTQGLVWHVKLLGNMVLQHVWDNGRGVVYPVDVRDKLRELVQKEYCEQFYDGINEKNQDRNERTVVDALQSLTATRTDYVSKKQLLDRLATAENPMTGSQAENALDNLLKLKVITYSEQDNGYRFPVELYRLYFRFQKDYPSIFPTRGSDPTFTRI